jgi:hypothetical protein
MIYLPTEILLIIYGFSSIQTRPPRFRSDILRKVETKKYIIKDTESQVYGFNAQQIENVLSYSVITNNDYIPNILKNATLELGIYDIYFGRSLSLGNSGRK